ncbi:gluconate 2-dehydrogenase subunit 3 family protein [Paenibacillus sp. sgz302251]|uniref:gluconate 2-dehydrogenase subunit 3 family protein n=1 Tax=Paenibacillus sp. sgz302251 TaxID=3414493 RepID=UPI003C7E6442
MSNMFFNEEEMSLVQAICSRLIPSEPNSPGAAEAHAHVYIDRALAGYFSHLQKYYRQRLQDFNDLAVRLYGAEFVGLSPDKQDDLLHKIELLQLSEDGENMRIFFEVIYEHTIEGTFGDPMYGGNRDFAGWKMIGFPGAHWGYTGEQMSLGYDSSQIEVLSVSDLLQRHKEANLVRR